MTIAEAQASIGHQFKLAWLTGTGLATEFDTIREVRADGWVVGDWLEAPAEDVRFKNAIPAQFINHKNSTDEEVHHHNHEQQPAKVPNGLLF